MIFLFTILGDDLYVFGGLLLIVVATVGTVLTSFKTIRTEGIEPIYKRFIEPGKQRITTLAELVQKVDKLISSFEEVKKEIKPNAGASLNDAVRRLEKNVDYAIGKLHHWDEMAAQALFEMDANGNLTRTNRALCDLIEADEAELFNKNWIVRIVADERQRVLREWALAIENKCPVDSLQTVNTGKWRFIKVRVQATPLIKDGDLRGFFGSIVKIEGE